MADLILSLSEGEYDDLQEVADDRHEDIKVTAHALLTGAVVVELSKKQPTENAYARGVRRERERSNRQAAFMSGFERGMAPCRRY
jgi:hypothetical protein